MIFGGWNLSLGVGTSLLGVGTSLLGVGTSLVVVSNTFMFTPTWGK